MSQYVHMQINGLMKADKVGEITIYGMLYPYKWEDTATAAEIKKAFDAVSDAKTLNVHINSPGGVVSEGMSMMDNLKGHKATEKNVFIEGMCASAATLIPLAATKVIMYEGSDFMIHRPINWEYGNADDLEKTAAELRRKEKEICSMYAAKCKQPEDDVWAKMKDEKWFSAQEAKDYGFVDEVIVMQGNKDTAQASATKGQMMMLGYKQIPDAVMGRLPETVDVSPQAETTPSEPALPGQLPIGGGQQAESAAQAAFSHMNTKEGTQMTPEELRKQHPDVVAQIENAAKQSGISEERARMEALDKVALPGYEQMVKDAKYGEKPLTAAEVSMQIVQAQMAKGPAFIANRQTETQTMQGIPAAPAPAAPSTDAEMDAGAKKCAAFAPAKGSVQAVQG